MGLMHRKTIGTGLLLGLALLACTTLAAAERDLAPATPEQVGMSSEKLATLTSALRSEVDDGQLAGIVTLVARHGKLVQQDHYGYQDLENGVAMEQDTIFRIFSMTKPITGVAMMMLHEEGKFALDDPVSKYIPEFADLVVAKDDAPNGIPMAELPAHPMNMRELMSHTGGLTYGAFSRSRVDTLYTQTNVLDRQSTLQDMIDKLANIPLRQQPGSLWHYSVSVDVQGYLVEKLSGKSFDVFLQERLFAPLGMEDTRFHVGRDKAARLSREYTSGPDGLSSPENGEFIDPVPFLSGGGGLTSTAQDYLRFAQMLANGGELDGVRILSPASVDLMRSNQLPTGMEEIPGYPGNVFGLDFAIVNDPAKNGGMSAGSYWWWGIAGSWFWIDPVEDVVFVGMIQNRNLRYARELQRRSKELLYDAIID
ncbi:MAG: beta-lactamase family protein [Pseudomonadales bacterium]|nr:beta-lactamase family protein [Pseudomonadales bacterium]MCP5344232.1 beta-lactamase family protein [Pseudomonadales bacterium]